MGYYAPSADDVYKYALRLDKHERSLTDRFGLSILFLNDTSPLCLEFLQRYCIDLCVRTADRVRFVFFSHLPQHYFNELAERMNQGYMFRQPGMLKNVLSMMCFHLRHLFNRFDFERDPWRSIRPEPFRPLRDFKDIKQQLDWQSDMKSAMPGIEESLKFAQKLGIGQYVPCFLIFSDIGDLHLDVMPIAGMSPEKAYDHVRHWVDQFYTENRETIEHWEGVEKSILDLCRKAKSSLEKIQEWPAQKLKTYNQLQMASRTIFLLEEQDTKACITLSENLERDYSLPYEVRTIIKSLHTDLCKFSEREELCLALQNALNRIQSASDGRQLLIVLNYLKNELFPQKK
jgi:hypothetical protein